MKRATGWAVLSGVLLASVLVRLSMGRSLEGGMLFGFPPDAMPWRVGAVQSAAAAGAALALAGLLLQGMLRNPLASPFVLGMSGGSQAAVSLTVLAAWRWGAAPGAGAQLLAGTVGGVAALLLCALFGRTRQRGLDPVTLVLAGVVVAAMAGSVTSLCEWLLPAGERGGLMAWGFGRIPETPDGLVWGALAVTLACTLTWTLWNAGTLDALQLGEDEAASVGVNLRAARWSIVLLSGALTACATALCGPLAFVGLVAPHLARGLLGASHRRSAWGTVLAGAALLVAADAVRSLLPVQGGRLPVGVVCALAGGPAFLWMLRRGVTEAWRA